MKRHHVWLSTTVAALVALGVFTARAAESQRPASRWEKNIQRFEQRDAEKAPPKGAALFLGSSSIVGWDLDEWFPDLATINRGFGGSEISDSIQFAERIAIPYAPRVIVFYAGDNDIAHGAGIEVIDMVREAGNEKFALRTKQVDSD